MIVSVKSLGIERLSVAKRLVRVEELWDSTAAATPLMNAQRIARNRRLADHEANPDEVASWEEMKSTFTAGLNKCPCVSSFAARRDPDAWQTRASLVAQVTRGRK